MSRMRSLLPDVLSFCGLALIVAAAAVVWPPLGLFTAGAVCLFLARFGTEA